MTAGYSLKVVTIAIGGASANGGGAAKTPASALVCTASGGGGCLLQGRCVDSRECISLGLVPFDSKGSSDVTGTVEAAGGRASGPRQRTGKVHMGGQHNTLGM